MNAILFLCRHIDLNLPESPLIQIISYFLTAALLFSQRSVRICYLRPHPKLVIVRSAAVLWFLAVSILLLCTASFGVLCGTEKIL